MRWAIPFVALLAACSRENNVNVGGDAPGATSVGKACTASADCSGGACVAGVCRLPCKADVECESGSLCLADGAASGCRLPGEASCKIAGSPCDNGALTCGLDATCRIPCSGTCARPGQVCIQGACVDEAEPGASGTFFACKTPTGPSGKLCDGASLVSCNEKAPGKTPLATCESAALCAASAAKGQSTCSTPACTPGAFTCGGKGGGTLQRCASDGTGYADVDADHVCATSALCSLTLEATQASGKVAPCTPPACAVGEGACGDGVARLCNAGRTGFDVTATCTPPTAQCNPGQATCIAVRIDATEVTREAYAMFLSAIGDADAPGTPATSPPAQPAACKANTDFTPTAFWGAGDKADGKAPVSGVDWCDARAYCASIGKRLCGRIGGGTLPKGDALDPSRSEWTNGCTAGGQTTHPFGAWKGSSDEETCNGAGNWLATETPVPLPVASKTACASKAVGYEAFRDLAGNVAEWEDACDASADAGTASDGCRVRGGSYLSQSSAQLACAADRVLARGMSAPDVGFRCCQ